MREFDYDLKKYEKITGKLTLSIPTYRQRLKMIKDCQFQIDNKTGQVNINSDTIDSIIKLLDVTKEHFKKIDLRYGTDIHVKNFDQLESYSEFDTLLIEAASSILNAGKLGK